MACEMGGPASEAAAHDAVPKPHVVLLAMPAPGHLFPFLALGKSLTRLGVQVTLLCSGFVSKTLWREVDEEEDDMSLLSVVVEDPILEPESPRKLVPWLFKLPPEEMADRTTEILQQLSPPPCLLIVDIFLSWSSQVAEKLSIPRHVLVTMSAATLAFMFSVPLFTKEGLLPMEPGTSLELNVPGVGNMAPGEVWEYFVNGGPAQSDAMIACLHSLTESCATATYLVNSVEELEPDVFHALKEPIPFTGEVAKVVFVGPLETAFATKKSAAKGAPRTLEVAEWKNSKSQKVASEVEQWLDAQPNGSVVYVSFGSIYSLQEEKVRELAHGLEASGQRFLWVIRPREAPQVKVSQQGPPVQEQIAALLPPGFEERTRGRGRLYSRWAPQPRILSHKAVGCFVSHCGWNSVLEAITTCTPILACPCFVDQWLNASFVEKRIQIGRVLEDENGEYERGRIESLVRRMMMEDGEERRNVVKMNQMLREAVTPSTGSSASNLERYVDHIVAMDQQLNPKPWNPVHALSQHRGLTVDCSLV